MVSEMRSYHHCYIFFPTRPAVGIASIVNIAGSSLCHHEDGHVYYIGAQLLGIIGFIDGSEMVATFGSSLDEFRGFLEGGWETCQNRDGGWGKEEGGEGRRREEEGGEGEEGGGRREGKGRKEEGGGRREGKGRKEEEGGEGGRRREGKEGGGGRGRREGKEEGGRGGERRRDRRIGVIVI